MKDRQEAFKRRGQSGLHCYSLWHEVLAINMVMTHLPAPNLTVIKGGQPRMTGVKRTIAFDPRGVVETTPLALAARVGALDGLRLGVLDNTKWNANRLLRKTVAKLQDEFSFAAVSYYRKESFSKDADPSLIAAIAGANDIVVTAIGD